MQCEGGYQQKGIDTKRKRNKLAHYKKASEKGRFVWGCKRKSLYFLDIFSQLADWRYADKCRKRVSKKVWTEHAKHVLEKTQTEAYLDFNQNDPEIKISQRCFEQLKPYFVKPARERDRLTCMWRQHVKLKIVFDACMRYGKSTLADSEVHKVNVYSHLGDLVKESLCPLDDESRYNCVECIQKECLRCGVKEI